MGFWHLRVTGEASWDHCGAKLGLVLQIERKLVCVLASASLGVSHSTPTAMLAKVLVRPNLKRAWLA